MRRTQALQDWISQQFPGQQLTLTPASADASFRRYFRATLADGSTRIIMDAPPEHEDCRPYLHIAQLLGDAAVHVPKVYAENLDQAGFAIGEQSARNRARALSGVDGNAHQRVISAGLVMAHFANVKAALFCQKRRVDHVHCIRITTHKAG